MTFNEWLAKKIEESGLSYSAVARRGGTSHARISQVLSGEPPGADFCVKIAKALGESPEHVLRLAGILDPIPEQPKHTVEAMVRDIWETLQESKDQLGAEQLPQPAVYDLQEDKNPPELEDIMEIVQRLDSLELQLVYDYARWRYFEQQHRRDSSGQRQSSEETELLHLVTNLSPEERKNVLKFLLSRED